MNAPNFGTGPPDDLKSAKPRLGSGGSRGDSDNSLSIAQSAKIGKGLEATGSSGIRTFRHRFKGGITCEVKIDFDKLRARQLGDVRYEWSRKPKPRVISEYRRWILSVLQRVADETGLKLMEMLQVKACLWECWVFELGQAPKKVEEVSC